MLKNIVIFGSKSILAKNFLERSELKNCKIIKISHKKISNDVIECDFGDLLTTEKLKNLCSTLKKELIHSETIFILFAWVGGPRTIDLNKDTWSKNINIILNFKKTCEIIIPSRIIYLSSAGAIYPQNIRNHYFKEIDPPSPKGIYGKQKYLSEEFINCFSKANNLKLTILRISSAYGFDKRFCDQGVINKWLFSAILNKKIDLYNSIDSEINFISFEQISSAIIVSIQKQINGTYNIGSLKSIALRSILEEIKSLSGKRLEINRVNNDDRFFHLDTSKFTKASGLKFEINLAKDIKLIYKKIQSFI